MINPTYLKEIRQVGLLFESSREDESYKDVRYFGEFLINGTWNTYLKNKTSQLVDNVERIITELEPQAIRIKIVNIRSKQKTDVIEEFEIEIETGSARQNQNHVNVSANLLGGIPEDVIADPHKLEEIPPPTTAIYGGMGELEKKGLKQEFEITTIKNKLDESNKKLKELVEKNSKKKKKIKSLTEEIIKYKKELKKYNSQLVQAGIIAASSKFLGKEAVTAMSGLFGMVMPDIEDDKVLDSEKGGGLVMDDDLGEVASDRKEAIELMVGYLNETNAETYGYIVHIVNNIAKTPEIAKEMYILSKGN